MYSCIIISSPPLGIIMAMAVCWWDYKALPIIHTQHVHQQIQGCTDLGWSGDIQRHCIELIIGLMAGWWDYYIGSSYHCYHPYHNTSTTRPDACTDYWGSVSIEKCLLLLWWLLPSWREIFKQLRPLYIVKGSRLLRSKNSLYILRFMN